MQGVLSLARGRGIYCQLLQDNRGAVHSGQGGPVRRADASPAGQRCSHRAANFGAWGSPGCCVSTSPHRAGGFIAAVPAFGRGQVRTLLDTILLKTLCCTGPEADRDIVQVMHAKLHASMHPCKCSFVPKSCSAKSTKQQQLLKTRAENDQEALR